MLERESSILDKIQEKNHKLDVLKDREAYYERENKEKKR